MGGIAELLQSYPDVWRRVLASVVLFAVLWAIRTAVCFVARRRITDLVRFHHWRRSIGYSAALITLLGLFLIWVGRIRSVATFLGLISAGLAIALHETIANLAGWLFIIWRRPFKVGDRIQVGECAGDVIDTRLFQFSLNEIGNWVGAEQSTGRILHVPNSRVLRDTVANYETGFEYIWHEIPVLITFESNWHKAKRLLTDIANEKAMRLSEGVEQQIRRAAMKYLIYFRELTPIVYTSVKDSGILLTLRYIVKPRQRRTSEQAIWEAILDVFAACDDIDFAYSTTRFYMREGDAPPAAGKGAAR